jgi:demethylmenaquinone methyltransferase/2-methoxy-6-polyprenyl-1,4-benzoquinol methylase
MNLELKDSSVDVVSIAFGIRNVQHPEKAIEEFYRILKPKGRVIILEFSNPPNKIIRAFNNFYTKRLMPLTATFVARDKSGAYKYLPKSVASFIDSKELASEITKVGFCEVKQVPQAFGVCTITKAIKN